MPIVLYSVSPSRTIVSYSLFSGINSTLVCCHPSSVTIFSLLYFLMVYMPPYSISFSLDPVSTISPLRLPALYHSNTQMSPSCILGCKTFAGCIHPTFFFRNLSIFEVATGSTQGIEGYTSIMVFLQDGYYSGTCCII